MPLHEPPAVSVTRRDHLRPGDDDLSAVVWLRGEHDTATRQPIAVMIAEAAALDDTDIVVDLSGVTYMDMSTIGALVVAQNGLRTRARSLSVRGANPRSRRLLEISGMAHLIDDRAHAQRCRAPS